MRYPFVSSSSSLTISLLSCPLQHHSVRCLVHLSRDSTISALAHSHGRRSSPLVSPQRRSPRTKPRPSQPLNAPPHRKVDSPNYDTAHRRSCYAGVQPLDECGPKASLLRQEPAEDLQRGLAHRLAADLNQQREEYFIYEISAGWQIFMMRAQSRKSYNRITYR